MTMRSRVRKFAHVLERSGLAMAGAAAGLFVAAHVGTSVAALTSQGFLLIMMVVGAVGFYLGIDTPQLPFHERHEEAADGSGKVDAAELQLGSRRVHAFSNVSGWSSRGTALCSGWRSR